MKIKLISLASLLSLFLASSAFAQCSVNGREVPCSQFPWWIFIIFPLVMLAFSIFWLWMLIDCIKRQFNDKVLWIILIVFLNLLGAILYYFIVKRKNTID